MNKRLPVVTSFVLFLLLCASTTYWVLEFVKPPQRPLAAVVPTASNDVPLEAAAGLFGGSTVKVAMASNFQLKGVVVAGNAGESIAIVVANGKPPQSVRINTEVQPGVVIKEVHGQYVLLAERGVTRRIDMQELAKNPMQVLQPSRFIPAAGVPPQRIETPPPMPAQVAPAMPTTMIVPAQSPPSPPSPMPPPPAPGQQYGVGVVIPPGSTEPSGPQRNRSSR